MGNLAKKHIQGTLVGPTYQPTTELFFDKVFGDKNKFGRDFVTDKGLVTSESISVKYNNGSTVKYTNLKQRAEYINLAREAISVDLLGVLVGKRLH